MNRTRRVVLALLAAALAATGCGSLEFAPTDPAWTHPRDDRSYEWSDADVFLTCGGRRNIAPGEYPFSLTIDVTAGTVAQVVIRRMNSATTDVSSSSTIGKIVDVHDRRDVDVVDGVAFEVPAPPGRRATKTLLELRANRPTSRNDPVGLGDTADYVVEIALPGRTVRRPIHARVVRGSPDFEWWEYVVMLPVAPAALVVMFAYWVFGIPWC